MKHAGRRLTGSAREFTSEATHSPIGKNQTAKPKTEHETNLWFQDPHAGLRARVHRVRTGVEGSRKKRVYDKPATLFERLKASRKADPKKIDRLERVKAALNPFKLKKAIERKLMRALQLQRASGQAAA